MPGGNRLILPQGLVPDKAAARWRGLYSVPSVDDQDCINTPTYDEGSWAYFVADEPSEGWVLSGTGASMRRPECGTSEAWVFTSGKNIEQQKPSLEPVIFSCSTN
jgi:hypothetical protein